MIVKKNTAAQLSKELGFHVSHKDDLRLYTEAVKWLGTPYKYGGNTLAGVDCSGLVHNIYKTVYDIHLERKAEDIYKKNCRKIPTNSLMPGDLVFFDTKNNRRKVNHMGIYLKDKVFLHASSSRGVVLNKMDEKYYRKSLVKGGRVKK